MHWLWKFADCFDLQLELWRDDSDSVEREDVIYNFCFQGNRFSLDVNSLVRAGCKIRNSSLASIMVTHGLRICDRATRYQEDESGALILKHLRPQEYFVKKKIHVQFLRTGSGFPAGEWLHQIIMMEDLVSKCYMLSKMSRTSLLWFVIFKK